MRARWERGAGKLLSLVFQTGMICAQLCPPPHSQMPLACGFPKFPLAGQPAAGSALAPQLGSGEKQKKKKGGTGRCWRHQRARANTSWSQVWVGNEELTGQRAGFLLPVSVKRRVFFPPNRWALESCNKVYHSVWHRPLPSQRSVLTDCNQDIH